MNAATEPDLEDQKPEGGKWQQDRRTGRRFVGGGHLDPDECDRFERVLAERLSDMTAAERDQWQHGSRKGRRR